MGTKATIMIMCYLLESWNILKYGKFWLLAYTETGICNLLEKHEEVFGSLLCHHIQKIPLKSIPVTALVL